MVGSQELTDGAASDGLLMLMLMLVPMVQLWKEPTEVSEHCSRRRRHVMAMGVVSSLGVVW